MAMTLGEYTMMAGSSLLAIINPLAAIPAFLAMTPHDSTDERLHMARRACITCAAVLTLFAAVGQRIFKLFGFTLPSFQIAGGLILLLVALDNIRARRSQIQETAEETEEGMAKADVSITPLAIPMLSGPGAITTAIVLASKAKTFTHYAVLYLVIVVVSLLSYLAFHVSLTGARRINPILMNITTRLMGLILAATAVEFILSALRTEGLLR